MSLQEKIIDNTFECIKSRKTKYHNLEIASDLHNKIYAPIVSLLLPYFGKYQDLKETDGFKNAIESVKKTIVENIDFVGIHILHKFNRIENPPEKKKEKKKNRTTNKSKAKADNCVLYFNYFCHYILKEYNQLRKKIGFTPMPYNVILQLDPVAKDDFDIFVYKPIKLTLYFALAIGVLNLFSLILKLVFI